MKFSHFLVACSFLMTPTLTMADEITNTLKLAYENNPTLKAKREEVKALDEGVAQAVSGWRPNINAEYNAGRQRTDFAGSGFNYGSDRSTQLVIDQPVFNGGETVARTRSSKALVKAGRADLAFTEQNVLQQAVEAYMGVVTADAVQELSANNAGVLGKQLQASQERFDVGEVTKTDVAQNRARRAAAEAQATQAIAEAQSARATYAKVVGVTPGSLSMPEVKVALPTSLDEAKLLAEKQNPQLEFSKYRAISAENDVDVQTSSLLPDVSLQAIASRQDNAGVFGDTSYDRDSIGVNVAIPLYQSGAEYSRVRSARNTAQRRGFEEMDSRNQVQETVISAWERYVASKNAIASREEAISAAEVALEGVRQEQEFGARTTLDVLDQEQERFQAQVALVRAKRDLVVSQYALLSAIGTLRVESLGIDTPVYQPEIHYDDVKFKMIGF